MKNSMELINTIKSLHADPEDMLVSFDIILLFTMMLNGEALCLPTNRLYVLSTLVHRARSLCNQESLHGELDFLRTTFR
jgi:hypothetical protein